VVGRSQNTDTVIVGERALFREGVAALLRDISYKIIASAKWYSELKDVHPSTGSRGSRLLDQKVIVLPQQELASGVTGLSDSAERTNSGDSNASYNLRFRAAPSLGHQRSAAFAARMPNLDASG
jgi:hypothetical protein